MDSRQLQAGKALFAEKFLPVDVASELSECQDGVHLEGSFCHMGNQKLPTFSTALVENPGSPYNA